jgi:hypothetical protein
MPNKNISELQRERRQTERAVAYWEQKARESRSGLTLTRLDPGQAINTPDWDHRFIIAPDRLAEVSTLLMCGSNVARSLELSEGPLKYSTMFRQVPKRFRELFTRGCASAAASGSPARIAGAIEGEDGRRELYRTVFMPVGVNLVFGAFNSIINDPPRRATKRPNDRFLRETVAVICEIQAAGVITPRSIATTLNELGMLTARGRS